MGKIRQSRLKGVRFSEGRSSLLHAIDSALALDRRFGKALKDFVRLQI